jgi:HK97 family phage portal protein
MSFTLYTADGGLVTAEDDGPWAPADGLGYFPPSSVPLGTWEGGSISYARLYRKQPWIAAVSNKLSRQIARLPLKVYEEDSQGNKRRVKDGRLYNALKKPAPRRSPIDLKQWLAFPAVLHGNAVVRKTSNGSGMPTSGFQPLQWSGLTPPDSRNDFWVYRDPTKVGARPEILRHDQVIHIHWHAPSGELGVSPLEQLGVTLDIESAAQRYQKALFRNSARPSGGVKFPKDAKLDPQLRQEIRADLAALNQGVENAGRPILLPMGAEFEPMSGTAVEAELIEQRKLTREEVAAVYDMPPPMVHILDKATYSNISEQHKMLFTTILGPWLVLIEEQFEAQVIDGEYDGYWVEFDLKEVLRGDPVKEAARLKTELMAGIATINEAREILNRSPIDHPNADRPMVPTNNVSFIGDEPAEEDDAESLAAAVDDIEKAIASASPEFVQALERAKADREMETA